jgi:transglutaminase-like putative cysteine protease
LLWGFVDLSSDDAFASYPRPTRSLNANHPDIVACAPRVTAGLMTARDKAVALYYAVRDEVR